MKIDEATLIVYDVETSGTDPATHDLLEIGAVAMSHWGNVGMFCELVKPTKPIPAEAQAVHGLTEPYLGVHGVARDVARDRFLAFCSLFHNTVFVAFNEAFDAGFMQIDSLDVRRLCAMRLAKRLFPDAPNHKNQTLRYYRNLNVDTLGIPAHRSLADALVTAALLRDELTCPEFQSLAVHDVDALIEYVERPILLPALAFGKHRGVPINQVPESYCSWALREMKDLDRDVRFTLEQRLKGYAA